MPLRESETLELKRSTAELEEALKSVCAMLNKQGRGEIVFGVEDNGYIIGQDIGKKTLREISKAISDHIEPKIYPKIDACEIDGKRCIRVSFAGLHAPYFSRNQAYMRTADENRHLSARELEALFLKKNEQALRWDDKPCADAALGDLDTAGIRKFTLKAGLVFDTVPNVLAKLGLVKDGKPLNTAILLFGKEPKRFCEGAYLRCAVFAGTGSSTIIDRQEHEGNLFALIEEAQSYVRKNTHLGMRVEGLERIDIPEINPEALREAVLNAFCHRDYRLPDSVNVAVFSDRVEIRSPGLLYGGLTLKRIVKERVSERRNDLLAQMLHRIHFVERWGRGIELILRLEPRTTFKEVGRQFITVFWRKEAAGERTSEKISDTGSEDARKASGPDRGEDVVKTWSKRGVAVDETEERIIRQIIGKPRIRILEICENLKTPRRTIEDGVARLKAKGMLRRIGPDKGGRWEVIKP